MNAHCHRVRTAAMLLAACGATPVSAQTVPEGLSFSGNLRFRVEAIDGQARAGFNASDALAETRAQLRATWQHQALRVVAELHDSREWGANPGTPLSTNEVNTLEPLQAFVQADLGTLLGNGTHASLQAGRFALELGSRRLVANDDYRNTTTGFTGLRGDVSTAGGVKATAVYVLPLARLPDDGASLRRNAARLDRESFDVVLWGGFLARQRKGSPDLAEISFLHFRERDAPGRPTRDRSLGTLGLRFAREPRPGHFDGGAEVIVQWGRVSETALAGARQLDVAASFQRLHVAYTWARPWQPRLSFDFDRASGDGPGRRFARFDTLFGMRRADLGPAGLYNTVARTNVVSPGVRVEVTPSKRVDAFIGYRGLWLADRHDAFSSSGVRDASGASGSFAGHQFDSRVRWWLVPGRLRFEADALILAKGRFLRRAPNAGPGATTRYGSLNLTVTF